MYQGKWRDRGPEVAYMVAMAEMAGVERMTYCPDVLVVYNYRDSFEMNASYSELAHEKHLVATVRSGKPYERIESL